MPQPTTDQNSDADGTKSEVTEDAIVPESAVVVGAVSQGETTAKAEEDQTENAGGTSEQEQTAADGGNTASDVVTEGTDPTEGGEDSTSDDNKTKPDDDIGAEPEPKPGDGGQNNVEAITEVITKPTTPGVTCEYSCLMVILNVAESRDF